MNAHLTPVIMVIDPDTLCTKAPKLTPYGAHVAFAASLHPWMTGLERLQRDQAFRDMEDTIRHEMEEEAQKIRRKAKPQWATGAEYETRRTINYEARVAQIIDILRDEPMTAKELKFRISLRGGAMSKTLRDMMKCGHITASPTGPNRAWVYEVTQ